MHESSPTSNSFGIAGNPLENIEIMANPAENFDLIMKDGKIYKNTLE